MLQTIGAQLTERQYLIHNMNVLVFCSFASPFSYRYGTRAAAIADSGSAWLFVPSGGNN